MPYHSLKKLQSTRLYRSCCPKKTGIGKDIPRTNSTKFQQSDIQRQLLATKWTPPWKPGPWDWRLNRLQETERIIFGIQMGSKFWSHLQWFQSQEIIALGFWIWTITSFRALSGRGFVEALPLSFWSCGLSAHVWCRSSSRRSYPPHRNTSPAERGSLQESPAVSTGAMGSSHGITRLQHVATIFEELWMASD